MIEKNGFQKLSVLIVGAGPNGLCVAASLLAAGADVHIHGDPMGTWKEKMPRGMILRSTKISSSIASPGNQWSIFEYERQTGTHLDYQPTINQFLAYSDWFQQNAVNDIDHTLVKTIRRDGNGFETELVDGRTLKTQAVVLAPGITLFPYIPDEFADIPKYLVSHSSTENTFDPWIGKHVIVLGKGQSALEMAALYHEIGAQVEIITRGHHLKFINQKKPRLTSLPGIHQVLYPPTDLAGPPHNWAIADPVIYRSLPRIEQMKLFELVGPIGSSNLEPRLAGVSIYTNVEVTRAWEQEGKIRLELSDGTQRVADHVVLATGFQPDIHRVGFLSEDLKAEIEQVEGYPVLSLGYESSTVKGLYILGALAARSQGPISRFVCGTYPVMQYLTEAITGSRLGYPDDAGRNLTAGRRLMYRIYQASSGYGKNKEAYPYPISS